MIAQTAYCVVDTAVIIGQFFRVKNMISIHAVREIIVRKVRSRSKLLADGFKDELWIKIPYPERIISSSMPYSFIC